MTILKENYAAMKDQAEAERAAQIEADAGRLQDFAKGHFSDGMVLERAALNRAASIIRAQPHDRTALDKALADAREKALREAASMFDADSNIAQTIIALIGNTEPAKEGK